MGLTRKELDAQYQPADVLYFEPLHCHPGSPVRASYLRRTGECIITCAVCDNTVVTLLIAAGPSGDSADPHPAPAP